MLHLKEILLSLLCCAGLLQVQAKDGPVLLNIKDFGAIPNDDQDDRPAFVRVLSKIKDAPGDYRILVPKGNYLIRSRIGVVGLKGNISFEGENGTVIKIQDEWFMNLKAASIGASLQRPVNRNDSILNLSLNPSVRISPGDLIHVQSSSIFETGWKYKENDLHQIRKIKGNHVALGSRLLFNYDPAKEKVLVTIFEKAALSFKNMSLVLEPLKDNVRAYVLSLAGFSVSMSQVNFSYTGKTYYYHNAVFLAGCQNVSFENMKFNNLQYGVTMSYCRDVTALNTEGKMVRHIYTPTTATINVNVNGLKGVNCHSAMDAHVAFNVTYENVVDTLATKYPTCRALGVTIRNARLSMKNKDYQLYSYWSVQTLTPEYKDVYKEYDSKFINVFWVSPVPGKFNGITTYICGRFIVDNCTTNSVSCYGKVATEMVIRNSTVGSITGLQKVRVENTVMNGKLYSNAPYVFKFRGPGKSAINNVKVEGYDENITYLFGDQDNSPKSNSLKLSDMKVSRLKGWTNKLQGRGNYNTLEVENSSFSPFKEEVQKEIISVLPQLRTIRKN
jgi:hypothetical protein